MSLELKQVGDIKRAYCVSCLGMRNCDVRGAAKNGDENYDSKYWSVEYWYLLSCRGCDSVFVQQIKWSSYDAEEASRKDEDIRYRVKYWPAPAKRKVPDWFDSVFGLEGGNSSDLDFAISELYRSLEADLRILSGIGVRTVFDKASEVLGVDPEQSFVRKLDDLVAGGHIGTVDRDRLSVLVDAGSASAHRAWRPTAEMLGTMMDILEHFLFRAFVEPDRRQELDKKTAEMKDKFPKRASTVKELVPPSPPPLIEKSSEDDLPF